MTPQPLHTQGCLREQPRWHGLAHKQGQEQSTAWHPDPIVDPQIPGHSVGKAVIHYGLSCIEKGLYGIVCFMPCEPSKAHGPCCNHLGPWTPRSAGRSGHERTMQTQWSRSSSGPRHHCAPKGHLGARLRAGAPNKQGLEGEKICNQITWVQILAVNLLE